MKRTIHLCALLFLTFIVINNVAAKVDLSNPKQPKNNLLKTTEKIAKVLKKELRILEKRATDGMSAKQRNTMVVDMAMKIASLAVIPLLGWVISLEVANAERDFQLQALYNKIDNLEKVNASVQEYAVRLGQVDQKLESMEGTVNEIRQDIKDLLRSQ